MVTPEATRIIYLSEAYVEHQKLKAKLRELNSKYPNDMELGEAIRKLISTL